MAGVDKKHSGIELTILAVILVVVLLVSPLTSWWASLQAPWYSPYLVWSIAIGVSWLLQRHLRKHGI